jgi:hypothetical protein
VSILELLNHQENYRARWIFAAPELEATRMTCPASFAVFES